MSSTGTGESAGKRPRKGEAENIVLSNLIRCNIRACIAIFTTVAFIQAVYGSKYLL